MRLRFGLPLVAAALPLILTSACRPTSPSKPTSVSPTQNALARQASPYLKAHASNPVAWQPWGAEALDLARKQGKLIFLSIGFSTCHWCHYMTHESFEDPEIAALLNGSFVSILVDREERPDVDAKFVAAVEAIAGSAGWPLTLILTPEAKPYFGGMYFPKPALKTLLERIASQWKQNPSRVTEAAKAFEKRVIPQADNTPVGPIQNEDLGAFVEDFRKHFDPVNGGLGKKAHRQFVPSLELRVLLRAENRAPDPKTLAMVRTTLDHASRGTIYDPLYGGFHRYATDGAWNVPHFEKMLYDQAAHARAYLEAYEITHDKAYERIARQTLDYVLTTLASPEGAFYSAQDADSQAGEGRYYTWSWDELKSALTHPELSALERVYGVTRPGDNLLRLTKNPPTPISEQALAKLRKISQSRPQISRDDKILTSWNGLMVGALAEGGRILGDTAYTNAAARAADYILTHCIDPRHKLVHRLAQGQAGVDPFVEDYAFLIDALLELSQGAKASRFLDQAARLQLEQDSLLLRKGSPVYATAALPDPELGVLPPDFEDDAVPSPESVSALNLIRLSEQLSQPALRTQAEQLLAAFPARVKTQPTSFAGFWLAVDRLRSK